MSFFYSFLTFLQPGILFPALADLRPALLATVLGFVIGWARKADYPREVAFKSPPFVWLAVFIIVQTISVYSTGLSGIKEEFSYWNVYLFYVVVSVLLITSEQALKRYVWGMLAGSMVVVAYGIYAVPAWGGYMGSGRAGAYGMYVNHNDYSFIIVQIFPFLYFFRLLDTSFLRKLLLALSMLACMAGMFLSLSRGGMIALMLEIFLLVILGMEGRKRWLLLPLMAVLAVGAISYQYAKRAENQGGSYTAHDAEAGRMELWTAGVKMFLANPVIGVGSRRFPEFAEDYYELSHDMRGKVSHNTYIEILSSTGLLGITSFLMMLKSMIKILRRRIDDRNSDPWMEAIRKSALIALLALLFRAFLDAKPHDWSFYVLCSIAVSIYALQRKTETIPSESAVRAGMAG